MMSYEGFSRLDTRAVFRYTARPWPPPPSHDTEDYLIGRFRKLASVKQMHAERITESIYQLERDLPAGDPLRAAFYRLRCEAANLYAELIARDKPLPPPT